MSIPYFRFYPSDFEADTSHLSMLEDGAYNRLLRLCWLTPGCSLPDDLEWIYRRCRARAEEEKEAVRVVLEEFFIRENQRVSNPRLTGEFEHASSRRDLAVKNGRKGGRPKSALKTNDKNKSERLANGKQKQTERKANQNQNQSITLDTDVSKDGEAVDFTKEVFDRGVAFLGRHGTAERQARSLIGKWRKQAGETETFNALRDANRAGVTDPVSWITARLKPPEQPAISDMLDKAFERVAK